MDLKLTVMNGQHLLKGVDAVSVDSDIFSLGRGSDNSCVLPDPKLHISSKHCVIHRKNSEYHLTDISTNGVYVNGSDEPIGRGRTAILKNADRLSMGEYVFRVDLKSALGLATADQEIEDLLTPDIDKDDQPEFADIMQTIAQEKVTDDPVESITGAKEAPISFDDLLGKPKATSDEKVGQGDISELLKPASPEKDHFSPPASSVTPPIPKEPDTTPEDPVDMAFVKPAEHAGNAIPDNWMDMESSNASIPSGETAFEREEPKVQSEPSSVYLEQMDVSTAVAEEMSKLHELEDQVEEAKELKPSPDEIYVPEEDVEQVQEAIEKSDAVQVESDGDFERKPTIIDIANALLDRKSETVQEAEAPKSQPGLDDLLNPDFVVEEPSDVVEKETLISEDIPESEVAVVMPRFDVTGAVLGDADPAQTPDQFSKMSQVDIDSESAVSLVNEPLASVPTKAPEVKPTHSEEVPSGSSDLFDLMLKEAGVPVNLLDGRDKTQVAKEFGQMIKYFSQGIVETLATRSLVKSEFRLQQTMIRPTDNNPLKFSPSGIEALKIMMFADSSAYMSASRSVEEGFKDIQAHQLAMMSGIQAAFSHLLKRFNPEHLEGKFDRRPRHQKGLLGRNKTDYWLEYRDFYEDICVMMEDEFQDLFSAEFGKAYEDQLRNLK
jgi:type VI secretion system FHA domain protein